LPGDGLRTPSGGATPTRQNPAVAAADQYPAKDWLSPHARACIYSSFGAGLALGEDLATVAGAGLVADVINVVRSGAGVGAVAAFGRAFVLSGALGLPATAGSGDRVSLKTVAMDALLPFAPGLNFGVHAFKAIQACLGGT
jgi:hypothetical protein